MNVQKKIDRILDVAMNEDLTDQLELLKVLKKKLPLLGGTKRLAAALLYEYLGSIAHLDMSRKDIFESESSGKIVFEDVKDGRARLFINIGKNHRISTGDLIREIVKRSGIDGKQIGKIDIHQTYSFFEVPESYAEIVYHSFEDARLKGVPVVVEPAKKRKQES
jgi:ATP-dependent RNA helicase DeaD